MNKMKKMIMMVAVIVLTSLTFVACGKPDISGRWYSTENNEESQVYLQIKDDQVTLKYAYVEYESGFLTVDSEVKTGKLLTGKVKSGSELEITDVYQTEYPNPFEGVDKLNYKLSKDKKTLSLSNEGEEGILDFVKKNPVATLE